MNEKSNRNVLEVRDLCVSFFTDTGTVKAVDRLSFDLPEGGTLGIVGESGSGKSVTSLAIMGLLKGTSGRITNGSICLDGRNLVPLSEEEKRKIRGRDISMIFQEPTTTLDPTMPVGIQIGEAIRLHSRLSKADARKAVLELLTSMGFSQPGQLYSAYPFQLSGGQCQRIMIAMAMSGHPRMLIADEPTTALDVTIQAQILDFMRKLKKESGTSILLITHNLGVVAEMCDQVLVMYCSRPMETGMVKDIFAHPMHPYTRGLLASIPQPGVSENTLYCIPGNVPDPGKTLPGCKFAPRCSEAMDICRQEEPPAFLYDNGHKSCCWKCSAQYGGNAHE